MTNDLDPNAPDDLDRLLRATLAGRAATVTSGPAWSASSPRQEPGRSRRSWLGIAAAAAAAAAVLVLAGGLTHLATSGDDPTPSGAGAPTCRTDLPAAWRTALAATPISAGGAPVSVSAVLADGRLIGSYVDAAKANHVVLVAKDGSTRELATVPADRLVSRLDQDGRYVVISSAPARPKDSPDSPVDAVDVVDLTNGSTRSVLEPAPIPTGWQVVRGNSAGAVVQNGVVYVEVQPADGADGRGEVISYTPRTGAYAVVARTRGGNTFLTRDRRGVIWQSGSVRAESVPEALPPFFRRVDGDRVFQPIVSDGTAAAWTERDDPYAVHWTDGKGDVRTFDVNPDGARGDGGAYLVSGVSGRFVTLEPPTGPRSDVLLDAKNGAYALTGRAGQDVASGPGTLVLDLARRGGLRVSTARLPELRC